MRLWQLQAWAALVRPVLVRGRHRLRVGRRGGHGTPHALERGSTAVSGGLPGVAVDVCKTLWPGDHDHAHALLRLQDLLELRDTVAFGVLETDVIGQARELHGEGAF